jgi:hypothetical protein
VLGQKIGRAARNQRDGGKPVGQGLEQLDDTLERSGRLRVVHDRAEGAVEVQAQGDLAGPRGHPGGVLGA